jgi:predicted class III extradiol MEMO1 family dioxygenase
MCFCGSKVICSDYEKCSHCRFSYTYYDKKRGPIYKSIEALDQKGIDIIESGDPNAFRDYLHDYGNTICGRHPIGVFLNVS